MTAQKLVVIAAITAVLFYFGLLLTERIPEIPVDIDQKPFFIPLLLLALLPLGSPTFAVAIGAALGEAFGDILEGYEVDDPFGFAGYFIGFIVAGYIIRNQPRNPLLLSVAALAAAFINAVFEAGTFLVFGEEGLSVAVISALGNTVTHGLVWGVIPLVILAPLLHGSDRSHASDARPPRRGKRACPIGANPRSVRYRLPGIARQFL